MLKSVGIWIVCWMFGMISFMPLKAQLTYEQVSVGWDDQFGIKQLMAIPIYLQNPAFIWNKNILSLKQGMSSGALQVSERGGMDFDNIRWIRVRNTSKQPVLMLSGEVLKGGRQDRMILKDTLIQPSDKDQYIPVVCIEEGRWSKKEQPFSYHGFANAHLRWMVVNREKQTKIWNEINFQVDRTGTKSKTKSYLAIRKQKENAIAIQEYYQYFEQKINALASNTNGLVFLSADKILGVELFVSNELMREYQRSFLMSYIESAVIQGGRIRVPKDSVELYLKNMLKDEQWQSYFLNGNLGRSYQVEDKPIYINGHLYQFNASEKP